MISSTSMIFLYIQEPLTKILYEKTNFKKVGFSTMAFTAKILSWRFRHMNIVGCFLIRKPTNGGSRAPQDPHSYAPVSSSANILQIADVALRVVFLLFLPCFQLCFRLVLTLKTSEMSAIFSSWMTQSCYGLLEVLERHSITHSLTHSLTHSILINLFIKGRLNTVLVPPFPSITFVPSALCAYVWHILEGARKAYIFSRHIIEQPAEDGFCINGNILKNTDNIICKKWTWN